MNKQQIIAYLAEKNGALDWWQSMRDEIPCEKKIALLESEIKEAKSKLNELRCQNED